MRMIKFKQIATTFLIVLMAVIFTFENPMKIFAESVDTFSLDDYTPEQLEETIATGTLNTKKQLYISDLMIATGDSEDEAKQILYDAGYIPYDANFMEGAGSSSPWVDLEGDPTTACYTYLGYKLTDNKADGITGISAMDQDGGYKKFDYLNFLRNSLPGVGDLTTAFSTVAVGLVVLVICGILPRDILWERTA